MIKDEVTESEVRKLRDAVYGPCSDNNWQGVKENWMRPDSIKWLKEKAAKSLKYT